MVAVKKAIRTLAWFVGNAVEADQLEILRNGYPSCYRDYKDCEQPCQCKEECKEKTIVIPDKMLKRWGL